MVVEPGVLPVVDQQDAHLAVDQPSALTAVDQQDAHLAVDQLSALTDGVRQSGLFEGVPADVRVDVRADVHGVVNFRSLKSRPVLTFASLN